MKISGFLGTLASVTPSLIVSFVTGWFDVFTGTSILRPQYAGHVEQTGIAIASFLAITSALLFRTRTADWLMTAALKLLLITVIFGILAIGCSVYLNHPRSRAVQELVVPMWDFTGVGCIVAATLTILFATMLALAQWAEPED
ncbi:hypothetical protein RFM26_08565 [Mesorhizobium sp. VK23B]|uniref:Uncharacterized protein n=1 Tax=Mesorhizobium dulcispinae TaxID=3072316 RepID=A0ABU4X9J0_9HYPH|nr:MULTISPECIES: hypothetical protein [unclassified Mesorhizobium]MDX8465734.1 hypothetical protein [Mesorhizobium sp. VK23B]MDX8471464.1 hypothetical protein [Mesorhizobium sp. VK23A]